MTPSQATVVQSGTYKPLARPLFIYAKGTSFKRPEVQAFLRVHLRQREGDRDTRSKFIPLAAAQLKKATLTFDLAVKAAATDG